MSDWARIGLTVGGFIVGGWFGYPGLGLLFGTYAGSLLFPLKFESEMPPLHDYPVQTSAVGIPVAIVYGTTRLAGNIVWMGELISYQIKHESGGKGGAPEQTSYETKYRRSFLISVCEGVATIRRAWKGKEEIPLSDFTSFDGDGNTGIGTLIGEDYAEYSNLCMAYFEDYELGNAPYVPNFIFEVSGQVVGFENIIYAGNGYCHVLDADYQKIRNHLTISGCMACDVAADGRYVYTEGVLNPGDPPIFLRDVDGVDLGVTFEEPSVWKMGLWSGVRFSRDGNFIFATFIANAGDDTLIKWNASTGDKVWEVTPIGAHQANPYHLEIDQNDNLYLRQQFPLAGPDQFLFAGRYDSDGNFLGGWSGVAETYHCRIDRQMGVAGVAFFTGTEVAVGKFDMAWAVDLNDDTITAQDFGNLVIGSPGYGIASNGEYVYILTFTTNGKNIWQCSPDLQTIYNSILVVPTGGGAITSILINKKNQLCVFLKFGELDTLYDVVIFDENLNRIEGHIIEGNIDGIYASDVVQTPSGALGAVTDENFAAMIKDLLINEKHGRYEESDLITEDFDSVISYCETNDLKGSLAITTQRSLPDWIEYICAHFQGYVYDIGGKIGLNCYRSQASVMSLTRNDLSRAGKMPPLHITKRPYPGTINRLEVAWTDRDNDYRISVVPAFDRIDQREAGQVRTKILDLKAITKSDLATRMAWRIFIDQIYRFSQYTFKLGFKSMLLEIGDVIDVTDGFLLTAKKMRAMSIEESKDGRSALITGVEDIADFYPAISYAFQENQAAIDAAVVLEDGTVAFRERWDQGKLLLSIAPGGAQCNGWYIYKSYDDISYRLVGRSAIETVTGGGANCTGTFESNLPAYPAVVHRQEEAFDVSIGTVVDLDTAITDDDFFNMRKLAKIGDEIIAYKTCVESAVEGTWRVSNLIRGLFGTEAVAHVPGETFSTLDIDLTLNLQESDIGKTIYFKVVSYYAKKIQLLSEVDPVSHAVQGLWRKPAPVSLMRLNNREGLTTYPAGTDVIILWYFCSKISGYGRGGYGNALWGSFIMDDSILTMAATLKKADDTEIISEVYYIEEIGLPMGLLVTDSCRAGNNPFKVELLPGSIMSGIGSREIQIEQV